MNERLPDPLSSLPPPATDRLGSGPPPRWRFAVAPLAVLLALAAVLAFASLYLRYAHAVPRPSPSAARAAATADSADAGGAAIWSQRGSQREPQRRPQRGPRQGPQREAAPPPSPPPPVPPAPGKAARAQQATTPSPQRASWPLPRQNGAPSSGADWLRAGYRAYRQQALDAAAAAYGNALNGVRPGSRQQREALLGAAAAAWRQGKAAEARRRYRQLLRRSPADPAALAGLAALRRDANDPAIALSALETAAAAATRPAPLYFALGGLYAARGRWPEAARAYRESCRAGPRPDCLFNLAASLDRLRRRRESLHYYRQALAAARERPAVFAAGVARARIRRLQQECETP